MLSYIKEQPDTLQKIFNEGINIEGETGYLEGIQQVFLVGCGSSLNAAFASLSYWRKIPGVFIDVLEATEFLLYLTSNPVNQNQLVVGISQSGKSSATVSALHQARKSGFYTLTLTVDEESPLVVGAHNRVIIECGEENIGPKTKGYTATILILILLTRVIYEAKIPGDKGYPYINLQDTIGKINCCIRDEEKIKMMAREFSEKEYGFFSWNW